MNQNLTTFSQGYWNDKIPILAYSTMMRQKLKGMTGGVLTRDWFMVNGQNFRTDFGQNAIYVIFSEVPSVVPREKFVLESQR